MEAIHPPVSWGAIPVQERQFTLPAWPGGYEISDHVPEPESEGVSSSSDNESDSDSSTESATVGKMTAQTSSANMVLINDDSQIFHAAVEDPDWPGGYAPACQNRFARIRPLRLSESWPMTERFCGHAACVKSM